MLIQSWKFYSKPVSILNEVETFEKCANEAINKTLAFYVWELDALRNMN